MRDYVKITILLLAAGVTLLCSAGSLTNTTDEVQAILAAAEADSDTLADLLEGSTPLTNTLVYVATIPASSTNSGSVGQYTISTNYSDNYLYWYSPYATNSAVTGIWLRVEGGTF